MIKFVQKQGINILRRPVHWSFAQVPTTVFGGENSFCTEATTNQTIINEILQSPQTELDLETLLKSAERKNLLVSTACDIVIGIASLKKDSKVSESDYLQDERFLKIMKQFEGTYTSKVEPMAIISSLKVRYDIEIKFSKENEYLGSWRTWNQQ